MLAKTKQKCCVCFQLCFLSFLPLSSLRKDNGKKSKKCKDVVAKTAGYGLIIFLIFFFLPLNSHALNRIYSLEKETTQILRTPRANGDHRITSEQIHWFIKFEQDEKFIFIIPEEHMRSTQPLNTPFYDQGYTFYRYHDEDLGFEMNYPISNRVLMVRKALLAAQNYFNDAAGKAGLELKWWDPDEPVKVVVGKTAKPSWIADANFSRQRIVIRPHWYTMDIHGVAVHEYFHLITGAVVFNGDKDLFWTKYHVAGHHPFRLFLNEMTAEWATDEPITIGFENSTKTKNLDTVNDYLKERSIRFLFHNRTPFFEKDQYDSNILIKYFAEQMAGKKDKSAAEHVLKLIKTMYDNGGVNKNTFFKAFTDLLPGRDFGARTWQLKWSKFFRAFCASNLIQKAKCLENPKDPLGYHDDAFSIDRYGYDNELEKEWAAEASIHSEKVFQESAQDDIERKRRLETLLGPKELVAPMAYKLHRIELNSDTAVPRPVFFFASGEAGSDTFLIRQKRKKGSIFVDRKNTTFDWKPEFTFSNQWEINTPESFGIIEDYGESEKIQDIWMGLINSGMDKRYRFISWAFQASPRLIPYTNPPIWGGSQTIHLTGGDASYNSGPGQGWYNGDTFQLNFRTTGPLHRKGTNLTDIPFEDLSLAFKILNEKDQEIGLDLDYGLKLKGSKERAGHFSYTIKGKIARRNPYLGKARIYLKLTSLLNLGKSDQQIDESYEILIRPLLPHVERVVISQDESIQGSQVIYDSNDRTRSVAKDENGVYKIKAAITFSVPMDTMYTLITAGISAPYEKYYSQGCEWSRDAKESICTFTIPKTDIPSQGALLRFAISGKSDKSEDLDADISEQGPQPNLAHFIFMGIDEFYNLSLWAKSVQKITDYDGNVMSNFGPVKIRLRLVPYRRDNQGRPNVYVRLFERFLKSFPKKITMLQDLVKANEDSYKAFKKNPEKILKKILKDKKKRLASFRKGIKVSPEITAKLPFNPKEFEQRSIERLEQSIKAQESNGNLAQEILAYEKKMWTTSKKQLDFVANKLAPGMEAMTRLMFSLRHFTYKEDLSGPVYVGFDGYTLEGNSKGWYSENYSDYQGKTGQHNVYVVRANADRWVEHDYWKSNGIGRYTLRDPILWVLDAKKKYLNRINQLVGLSGAYPDFMTQPYDPGPKGWERESGNKKLINLRKSVSASLSVLPNHIDWKLLDISKHLWDFFPKKMRPDFEHLISKDRTIDKSALILPVLNSQRLFRLHNLEKVVIKLPVRVKGYTVRLFYDSSRIRAPSLGVRPTETDVIEKPRVQISRTKHYYEPGFVERKEISLTTWVNWMGFKRPPGFFGLNRRGIIPHQSHYSTSLYSRENPVVWSLGEGTGIQYFDESADSFRFYTQSEEPFVEGILKGVYQYPAISSRVPLDIRWKSRWRLDHVGEIREADIKIDIPRVASSGPDPDDIDVEETAQPVIEPRTSSHGYASSYDPQTGMTTESKENPDGSHIIRQLDRNGNVISSRNEPGPGQRLPSASSYDPDTGITTSSQKNTDGTVTITQKDKQGKLFSQRDIGK
ncbi:MAG: hypothetical protein GY699_14110 [Desulfobacteraceae bacterium]|nr:hypothetical protein [Desulfobacteraceae bacterium]